MPGPVGLVGTMTISLATTPVILFVLLFSSCLVLIFIQCSFVGIYSLIAGGAGDDDEDGGGADNVSYVNPAGGDMSVAPDSLDDQEDKGSGLRLDITEHLLTPTCA